MFSLHGLVFYAGRTETDFSFLFRKAVESATNLHPTYFGILIGLSALFIVHSLLDKNKAKWKQVLLLVWVTGLIFFLFLLAARMAIIGFTVGLIALVFFKMKSKKVKFYFSVSAFTILVLAFLFAPSLRNRAAEIFAPQANSTNMRAEIYFCSIKVLQGNWLLGTGTQNQQSTLNDCYEDHGFDLLNHESQYNSHNEYVNIWAGKGIVAFLIFLSLLVLLFYMSHGKPLFLAFMLLVTLVFLTENLLDRQIGVFFFAIFVGYFGIVEPFSKKGNS